MMPKTVTIRIGDRDALYCIRRWCMEAMLHSDEDERECEGCTDHPHILRKRRTYVCQTLLSEWGANKKGDMEFFTRCEMGFFTREAFLDHECGSAY